MKRAVLLVLPLLAGLMGASASPWHVRVCLTALADALGAQGRKVDLTAALDAANAHLG